MQTDAVFADAENGKKLKVVQGAPFIHEGVMCYWRRKRNPETGELIWTVEVPAEALHQFKTEPARTEMAQYGF